MAGEVENNIQSIPESANSAGNYHKGNGNTDDCTTFVHSKTVFQDLLLLMWQLKCSQIAPL